MLDLSHTIMISEIHHYTHSMHERKNDICMGMNYGVLSEIENTERNDMIVYVRE